MGEQGETLAWVTLGQPSGVAPPSCLPRHKLPGLPSQAWSGQHQSLRCQQNPSFTKGHLTTYPFPILV